MQNVLHPGREIPIFSKRAAIFVEEKENNDVILNE